MTNPQITAELASKMEARVKTVAEESSVTAAERVAPETEAVWTDKSRNILEHSRNMERQRDEVREERDAALAKLKEWERGELRLACKHEHEALDFAAQTLRVKKERNAALAKLSVEQVARKALIKALLICIRYADSSADTEQAHAALALAAKLP